ncbi:MAG TPA: cell division protein FtsL [Myxococcota bacterium]|nr:cell division protein FtsL [Myxococcota bacterium]
MLNSRLRQSGPWFQVLLALALGVIAASGGLVYVRTRLTSLRYELGRRVAQEHALSLEVERLRIEATALSAPERIEPRARALGLTYPKPDQIVALEPDGRLSHVAAGRPR